METKSEASIETIVEAKSDENQTRADNNSLVIQSLVGIALLCIVGSVGVLVFKESEDATKLLSVLLQPVPIIVAGFIGFLKS